MVISKEKISSSLMIVDQLMRMVIGFAVTLYVARKIGPDSYGIIAYGMATVGIVSAISGLGLESIIPREFVSSKKNIGVINSAMALALLVGILGYTVLVLMELAFNDSERLVVAVSLYGVVLIFQPIMVIDFFYNAAHNNTVSTILKLLAMIISNSLKFIAAYLEFTIDIIIFCYVLDTVILSASLLFKFIKDKNKLFTQIDSAVIKKIVRSSIPLCLATAVNVLYMKLDQLMIVELIGAKEGGVYAAMAKINEGFMLIIVTYTLSLIPEFQKYKNLSHQDFEGFFVRECRKIFYISLAIAICVSLVSEPLIAALLGDGYTDGVNAFNIMILSCCVAVLGSMGNRWLVIENMEKMIVWRNLLGLLINVPLNYILIPAYGLIGAVIATLIAMTVANVLADWAIKELRQLALLKIRAVFFKG